MRSGGRDWLVKASWVNTEATGSRCSASPHRLTSCSRCGLRLRRTLLLTLGVILVVRRASRVARPHIAGNVRALTDQARRSAFRFQRPAAAAHAINEILARPREWRTCAAPSASSSTSPTALASERNFGASCSVC